MGEAGSTDIAVPQINAFYTEHHLRKPNESALHADSGGRSLTGAIGTQVFLSKRTSPYAQVALVNNTCAHDGVCLGSGLSVESGGSGVGGLQGLGTAAAGQGMPPATTVGADVGIRVLF